MLNRVDNDESVRAALAEITAFKTGKIVTIVDIQDPETLVEVGGIPHSFVETPLPNGDKAVSLVSGWVLAKDSFLSKVRGLLHH